MSDLTNYERESIINWNNEEKTASVYTCSPTFMRVMDGLMARNGSIRLVESDKDSKTYEIPKSYVRIRIPRVLSSQKHKELVLRAKQNLHRKKV